MFRSVWIGVFVFVGYLGCICRLFGMLENTYRCWFGGCLLVCWFGGCLLVCWFVGLEDVCWFVGLEDVCWFW